MTSHLLYFPQFFFSIFLLDVFCCEQLRSSANLIQFYEARRSVGMRGQRLLLEPLRKRRKGGNRDGGIKKKRRGATRTRETRKRGRRIKHCSSIYQLTSSERVSRGLYEALLFYYVLFYSYFILICVCLCVRKEKEVVPELRWTETIRNDKISRGVGIRVQYVGRLR